MPTPLENLKTARETLVASIAAQEALDPRDYSLEGQAFQHLAALNAKYERLIKLNDLIQTLEPFEIRSEVM